MQRQNDPEETIRGLDTMTPQNRKQTTILMQQTSSMQFMPAYQNLPKMIKDSQNGHS